MSSSYRAQCNLAKQARAGIVEQRPGKGGPRNKGERPFVLECLPRIRRDTEQWRKWSAYRSREEADRVLAKHARTLPSWGWRIVEVTSCR